MFKIFFILFVVVILSYLSQKQSIKYENINMSIDGRKQWDIFLILLVVFLILLGGLRTNYNDTATYITGFNNSLSFREFMSDINNFELMGNPLFYLFQSFIRTFTYNYTVFFIICSIITNVLIVRFIKRNVIINYFWLSMFLYCCLGLFTFSLAAQKQILAMSILTLSLESLFEKKYFKFYMVVLIAGLIHTYAWVFIFLPLFNTKPWSIRTYLLLILTFFVMLTFENTLSSLVALADQIGKGLDAKELLEQTGMNYYRVAVYSVVPIMSLVFKRYVNRNIDLKNSILIQMSILTLVFMLLGSISAANMFGRMGIYFELGYICSLPYIIQNIFENTSIKIVLIVTTIFFLIFFYMNNLSFSWEYQYKTIMKFISEVI